MARTASVVGRVGAAAQDLFHLDVIGGLYRRCPSNTRNWPDVSNRFAIANAKTNDVIVV